jgi:hypothetical protein
MRIVKTTSLRTTSKDKYLFRDDSSFLRSFQQCTRKITFTNIPIRYFMQQTLLKNPEDTQKGKEGTVLIAQNFDYRQIF